MQAATAPNFLVFYPLAAAVLAPLPFLPLAVAGAPRSRRIHIPFQGAFIDDDSLISVEFSHLLRGGSPRK